MHTSLHLLEFWVLAFMSLGVTLVLLNIFWNVIGQDLCPKTLGQEAAIAGLASLVEAVGLWLLLPLGPMGMRAMIIPGLLVGLIYKIAHLEDWGRYEIICLLFFQMVISLAGAALLAGHFFMVISVVIVFAVALGVVAAFMKGL